MGQKDKDRRSMERGVTYKPPSSVAALSPSAHWASLLPSVCPLLSSHSSVLSCPSKPLMIVPHFGLNFVGYQPWLAFPAQPVGTSE